MQHPILARDGGGRQAIIAGAGDPGIGIDEAPPLDQLGTNGKGGGHVVLVGVGDDPVAAGGDIVVELTVELASRFRRCQVRAGPLGQDWPGVAAGNAGDGYVPHQQAAAFPHPVGAGGQAAAPRGHLGVGHDPGAHGDILAQAVAPDAPVEAGRVPAYRKGEGEIVPVGIGVLGLNGKPDNEFPIGGAGPGEGELTKGATLGEACRSGREGDDRQGDVGRCHRQADAGDG